MKTKFRLLTIVFALAVLAFFAIGPYVAYHHIMEAGAIEVEVATVMSSFLTLLFLGGLVSIVVLAKVVTIDEVNKRVIILHPLLLKRRVYSFSEIIGFRWVYLNGRIAYKSIKLKVGNGKVFQFSDFEIGNFREIEEVFLRNFQVRCGKDWRLASEKGKMLLLNRSRIFDFEQAKDIRAYIRLGIVAVAVLKLAILYKIYQNGFVIETVDVIYLSFILLSLCGLVAKLRLTDRFLMSYKHYIETK